jgi:acetylornithine deacetylase/succinyl-diaminopimelate desuccinylase-like protein
MSSPSSVIDLCQTLVRIPSVNPHGEPGTHGTGEARIALWMEEYLTSIGAKAEQRQALPGRPNVVAHWPADRPGKPRILFAPHTDTVSVAGMEIDPFGGAIRDGKLWGRGASDTKGPMAAMLWALKEMSPELGSLPYEIWFAGLAGEEAGQHGAKALAAEEEFAFVIAGEPTSLDVVHTHKGCTQLRLITHGRASHSARPELGDNAIYKMADVVRYIRDVLARELGQPKDVLLGSATISVGTINGGSKTNIVPDRCEATVDIRTIPDQNTPGFFAHIRRRLLGACPNLEIEAGQSPPLYTNPAHPIIGTLTELGSKCVSAPWFCDAAIFAARGVPSIALGPGSIAQAHTADEWINVSDLEAGVAFFKRFLSALGTQPPRAG